MNRSAKPSKAYESEIVNSVPDNDTIEASQYKKIVAVFLIGTSIILLPGLLASEAKQDAWISSVAGWMAGLLLVCLYNRLGRLYPGKSLVACSKEVLGAWAGTAVSLLWCAFSVLLTVLVLRNLGDFLTSAMMPETPASAIHLVYLCIVMIGLRYGIVNIARTLDIFYPCVIALFILFSILLVPDLDVKHLQPILGRGIKPVLHASIPYLGFPFLELVLLLMIFPNVKQPNEAGKAFLKGTFIAGALLFVLTLMSILVLGAEATASDVYSSFELAKKIEIGEFIQRIEAIMAVLWFITIFFKVLLCCYISVSCFAQTLRLADYRPLSLPMGMIFYALSLVIVPNMSYLLSFDSNAWPPFALTFGLLLPLLLLVVSAIRRRNKPAA